MAEIRRKFASSGDGVAAITARASLVDGILRTMWAAESAADAAAVRGIAVVAVGGYGRAHLFPCSDIDVLFCGERGDTERAKAAIRRVSQALWDCGLKVAPSTRTPAECERFQATNPEFGVALLDLRFVCGAQEMFAVLRDKSVAKMKAKDGKAMAAEMASLTRERYGKYGNTLFHLEPNVKDCPGGLRDANVCGWLTSLRGGAGAASNGDLEEFSDAVRFLAAVRCFLHFKHDRDDNTLDWQSQDAAAEKRIGLKQAGRGGKVDAAYWMRAYFRHARMVERRLLREVEASGQRLTDPPPKRSFKLPPTPGFTLRNGVVELAKAEPSALRSLELIADPAGDPEVVLAAFAVLARTGARLSPDSEQRIEDAIPSLSALLEEGPGLWRQLSEVLTGEWAGQALRAMHALGVLELILPEFHGIDALVIRDAYHRYTVDEHTFVLIDTLHELAGETGKDAPEWRLRLGAMIRELHNPGLLYLAALLHDTGKARAGDDHAADSARMARSVLARLEMDAYDSALVTRLIELHLEMSAALRRDIFDAETVRAFAAKVQTHEALRMLTLFTYADIAAVHPDALTPWKAENLWRLSMATGNQLDRNVDDERVHARTTGGKSSARPKDERVARVLALQPGQSQGLELFLEGFPERYLSTRSAETIAKHFAMTQKFAEEPFQIAFVHGTAVSEITLVTRDRPSLFANMAGALAAWGMNVVTADAFANGDGVVVDSFRFTDTFRTLELNASERERFVASVRGLVAGRESLEKMLRGRRRQARTAPRLVVETRIDFDRTASLYSTVLQVVAQDVPGLLRAISHTISSLGHNVEVALVDTEGDTAIDVFYLTNAGSKLNAEQETALREALQEAIRENAGL
jgi:[protein-PII] uridylyltransferase